MTNPVTFGRWQRVKVLWKAAFQNSKRGASLCWTTAMAVVQQRDAPLFEFWKAAFHNTLTRCHLPKVTGFVMCHLLLWLICDQHFHNHPARLLGAVRTGMNDHAFSYGTDAGGHQRPFPFDLDHTGAAIAVGSVSWLVAVT